ncbi:chymotrypsin-1-like [Phymastichus coffea]|uniref:chymotrypsin-1-like n=1 Tax=Phymastichus coffea TaxID=108790 RepID=UPI00273C44F1|nr:chymotrypsin-1-like [Phymastichus coffea]
MFTFKLVLLLVIVPLISAHHKERIIDGQNSDPSSYTYHVAILKVNGTNGEIQHICGGAIIDRRFVLTAAHCVYDIEREDVIIRAGGNQAPPADKPHLEKRYFKRVTKIMYPKDYVKDPRYHEYDIALLKIEGTFDLGDREHFRKLQLPNEDNDYEEKWATVSGYGVHEPDQGTLKAEGNGFKSLKTKVISIDECQTTRTYILTAGSLCTLSIQMKGHTCYGDGGNPLVYDNQIIGILNNPSTCDDTRPELYTKVSEYLSFIKKVFSGKYSSDILYK